MKTRFLYFPVILGLVMIGYTASSSVNQDILKGRRVNLMFFLTGNDRGEMHPDGLRIISYEPRTGFLDLVSVPAGTMLQVPYEITWRRVQRLDEVYARLYEEGAGEPGRVFPAFRQVLEEFLEGRVEIDYYIRTGYGVFADIADAVGGVKFEVVADNGENSGLYDVFPPGIHNLSGEKALEYISLRERISGRSGRKDAERMLLAALLKKLKSPAALPGAGTVVRAVLENTETSLTAADLIVSADVLRGIGRGNIRTQILDGEPVTRWGRTYWTVNRELMRDIMDVVVNSQLYNLPPAPADRKARATRRITAEVWNATRRPGLARELTEYLRRRNVDVVRYGNFGSYRQHTQVISRTGDLSPAREVANIIGCRNIITEIDLSRMADINVVIGNDIKELWE